MKKYYPINNLFLPIIFLFSSCITIDQKFGDDLIPNEQDILVSRKVFPLSNFGILSHMKSDSFPTSDITVGFIGQMTTPSEFGSSKVSLMTQLTLTIPEYTLPSDAKIDSVVMYVTFTADKFGNKDNNLTLKVHEVTADLTDSLYYGGNDDFIIPSYDPTPFCSGTFNKYTKTMQMKVPEPEKLLTKLTTFSSDTLFKKVFKGIYMTVEGTEEGSIKGVDLLTRTQADGNIYYASTFLRMHYKYFHPTAQRDTVAAYTYICQSVNTNKDKRFLITKHTEINQPLNPKITYTKGLYGVTSNLKIDREKIEQEIGQDLDNIAINRAELRLTLEHPLDVELLDSFYTPLIGTYTKEYSSTFQQSYYAYTLDFNKYISAVSQGGGSTYDGFLNRTTGTYNIEITHALNNLIRTNNFEKELILLPQSYGQSFKSAAFITDSTKLVLTYVRKKQ